MLLAGQESQQLRQSNLNRVPDDIQIDVEVAMSDPVTHPAHAAPGSLSVLSREFRKPIHYFGCRLANDNQAHDDRLLRPFVVDELFLAQTFDEDQRIARSLTHMLKVIAEPVRDHTGRACSSTC